MDLPPGPRLPAAAQTLLLLSRPTSFLDSCARKFGDVFTLRLSSGPPTVVVTGPADVQRLWALMAEEAHTGEENAVLEPLLGPQSVLMLDGAEHLRQRRLLSQFFHGERMRRHGPVIAAITAEEVNRWPIETAFAVLPRLRAITFEVILRVVFGLEAGSAQLNRLRELLGRLLSLGSSWMVLPWLRRDLGPWSPWGRFVDAKRRVDEALIAEIRQRRAAGSGGDDALSMLLGTMTDGELRDELMTLLIAGHETTATALAWWFELVLRRPELVELLRAEAAAGGPPRLLEATIREALRLRPIFRFVSRRLQQPLEIAGRTLPAGVSVSANVYLTQRRHDLYPDPEAFRPERFLDGSPEAGAWIPFGGGIRRCLGASFATYEMGVVIRTVLAGARLRPASPTPEPISLHAVTLVPRHGARVIRAAQQ